MAQNGFLVCSPLMAETVEEMLSQMQHAKDVGADCIEIRLDCLNGYAATDLEQLMKARVLPTIVTYRLKSDGGKYEIDEKKRLDTLRLAHELGADFIDVELQVIAMSDF